MGRELPGDFLIFTAPQALRTNEEKWHRHDDTGCKDVLLRKYSRLRARQQISLLLGADLTVVIGASNSRGGLHRCVKLILSNAALIRASGVCDVPKQKAWRDDYRGRVDDDYTQVPLILNYLNSIYMYFCWGILPSNALTLSRGRYSIVYWRGSVQFNVCINTLQYRTLSVHGLGS